MQDTNNNYSTNNNETVQRMGRIIYLREINVYNQIKVEFKLILPNDLLYIMYSYLFQYIKIVRNKENNGDEMRFHYAYYDTAKIVYRMILVQVT